MKEHYAARIFLIRDDQILMGTKKDGPYDGMVMSLGGSIEDGETPEQAAIREAIEEAGVTPIAPVKTARIACHYKGNNVKLITHIFVANDWEGEIIETEEMTPEWHYMDMIPTQKMWPDSHHWLPLILEGNGVVGDFFYDEDEQLVDHSYEIVDIEQVPR